MNNKIKVIILSAIVSVSLALGIDATAKSIKKPANAPANVQKNISGKAAEVYYEPTNSLDIVANPTKYLNKHVKIKAKFDKFTTLGLDYKPAYRSSEKYITFLIKRDDVVNHTIPLSEMKNFLERSEAEKYVELSPGDEIEYSGVVFSDALGDAWVSVEKFNVVNQKVKSKNPVKK